jgi:hypothetical protein
VFCRWGKKDENEVVDQGEDIGVGERVSGGLRRRRHQPSKLSDGGGAVNSGEKFAQPGGAKIGDFGEQKRRRFGGIYRSKNPRQTPTKSVRFLRTTSPFPSRTGAGYLAGGWRQYVGSTRQEKKKK